MKSIEKEKSTKKKKAKTSIKKTKAEVIDSTSKIVYCLVECPNCLALVSTNALIQVICPDCGYPVKIAKANIYDACTQTDLDLLCDMEDIRNGLVTVH